MTVSDELGRFPPEAVALHEQLRSGKLELKDIQGLDVEMRNMLNKMEELTARRD
ncbi:unnamed protein product, partial [Allacma fusca]